MARSDTFRARILAVLLVALVGAPALAIVAAPVAAQGSAGDLVVSRIDYGDPTVGRETTVRATIRNVGGTSIGGTVELAEVQFFWNASGSFGGFVGGPPNGLYHWLNSDAGLTGANSRVPITEAIGPGEEFVAEITWTPSESYPTDGPQRGRGQLIVYIAVQATAGQNPDGDLNNNRAPFDLNVKYPRVKLTPLWTNIFEVPQIKKRCEAPPAPPMTASCKQLPGTLTTFEFQLHNRGNFRDTFEMFYQDVEGAGLPALAQWNVTFSPPNPVLGPGEKVNVLMLIQSAKKGRTAEDDHEINTNSGQIDVRVIANSTTGVVDGAILVEEAQSEIPFPTLRVDQLYDINMTYKKDEKGLYEINKFGNVTRPITWNFTLNNNGNGEDRVNVSIDFPESDIGPDARAWNATINSFTVNEQPVGYNVTTLNRNSNDGVTLTVVPPERTPKGEYVIRVNARSEKDVLASLLSADSDEFRAIVYQTYALEKRLDIPVQQVRAAEPAVYPLYISNNGNGPDPVTFKVENIPSGWTARLDKTRLTIPAYSTSTVNLTVTPPAAERENRFADVFVNVTSSGPLDRNRAPLEESKRANVSFKTHTEVRAAPNIVLSADASTLSGFVDPGKSRSFDVRVRNVGNRWDNVTFTFDRQPLEWSASVNVQDKITLAPRQERVVTVTVTAPSVADLGEIGKVALIANSEDRTERERVEFAGKISGPDLFVGGISVTPIPVYQEDEATIEVVVGNRGNKEPLVNGFPQNATLRVSYVQNGEARQIGPALTVSKLTGSTSYTILVPWDTRAVDPGPGVLQATIDPEDEIAEIDDVNGNTLTLGGEAAFVRKFNVDAIAASAFTARPGEVVNLPSALRVRNLGNAPEPLRITLKSQQGWAAIRQDPLTLVAGEERVFPLTIAIPARPGVGNDMLEFLIEPELRPGRGIHVTLPVAIRDEAPPTIRNVRATPAETTLGGRVSITAEIADAVGVKLARAFVKDPLNTTHEVALVKGAGDSWSAERSWTTVGFHQIYVEAVDAAATPNSNTTRLAPITFKISPGSAPKITVLTKLNAPIRAGTPIAFDITDPLGVARAWYVLGGVETDLPRTWRLSTDNFSSGTYELTLHAENVYGVRSTATFAAEVDNSPPEVLKTTLDPAKPKAGEEATLRIQTAPAVEAVDVVVKRGGETVDTIPATKQGTGLFIAKYTPSAGNYEFDVVAKDSAGNTNLEKGVLSAKVGGGIFGVPGFEIWMALAAVALALVARRRR